MFCQFRQDGDFLINHGAHTVGHMFLMSSVDGNTFFAVAVITTGLGAGSVILLCVFCTESGCEFFLYPKSFFSVAKVKFLHSSFFNFISINNHLTFPFFCDDVILSQFILEK